MKKPFLAAAFAVFAGVAGAHAQSYPSRPITIIVPFAPGRRRRHLGPHRRGIHVARARRADRRREHGRRRRHGRHDPLRPREPRRLHHRARPHGHACGFRPALPEPGLQAGCGLRADRPDLQPADRSGDAPGLPGEQPGRIRQPTRRRTRRSSTWRMPASARCRSPAASAQLGDRHQADFGAVHRHRSRNERRRRRPGGLLVRHHPGRCSAGQRRHDQGAGDCHRQAQRGAAERADRGRGRRARLPGGPLLRAVRAQGNAETDHRQACRCARQGARPPGRAPAPERSRRRYPGQEQARPGCACSRW